MDGWQCRLYFRCVIVVAFEGIAGSVCCIYELFCCAFSFLPLGCFCFVFFASLFKINNEKLKKKQSYRANGIEGSRSFLSFFLWDCHWQLTLTLLCMIYTEGELQQQQQKPLRMIQMAIFIELGTRRQGDGERIVSFVFPTLFFFFYCLWDWHLNKPKNAGGPPLLYPILSLSLCMSILYSSPSLYTVYISCKENKHCTQTHLLYLILF